MTRTKNKVGPDQPMLPGFDELLPEASASPTPEATAPVKPVENPAKKSAEKAEAKKKVVKKKEPATELMKKVAAAAPMASKNMKKVFTDKEIAEINEIREKKLAKKDMTNEQKFVLNKEYRRLKGLVREMEKTNQSQVILFPSDGGVGMWYKALNTSALYYAYRLAPMMGRASTVYHDKEKFLKCDYVVSVRDIDDFIAKFTKMETSDYMKTEDGIYIFNLKKALKEDEVGELRRIEGVRRDRMRDVLKPKAMDPKVYQELMRINRELMPRICKMQPRYYQTVGDGMARAIHEMIVSYFDFADGLVTREEEGKKLIDLVNTVKSGVAMLSELRIWSFDTGANIGENVAHLKNIIINDFNLEITKD